MDDLLALLENEEGKQQDSEDEVIGELKVASEGDDGDFDNAFGSVDSTSHKTKEDLQPSALLSVDDKVQIHMVRRKVSSIELLDIISSHKYQSTASMTALSLATWNSLLERPAALVSADTVTGRTHVATVGIVFSNSGTKLSSSGRAFSILKIGTLSTGPIVSVLLFGNAYSQYTTKTTAGMVVALRCPSLMPSRGGGDTAVSLSINDVSQLIVVAHARDYGTCPAQLRSGRKCSHFVDKSKGRYCQIHKKLALVNNGPVKPNLVQQMKTESSLHQKMNRDRSENKRNVYVPSKVSTRDWRAEVKGHLVNRNGLSVNASMVGHGSHRVTPPPTNNRFLNGPTNTQKPPRQGPLLQAANKSQAQTNSARKRAEGTAVRNPYMGSKAIGKVERRMKSNKNGGELPVTGNDSKGVSGNWLNGKGRSFSRANKKRPIVNTDGGGFDGSVLVPKPSKLFRRQGPTAGVQPQTPSPTAPQKQDRSNEVLEKQRQLKEKMKAGKSKKDEMSLKLILIKAGNREQTDKKLAEDALYGRLKDVDLDAARTAKSRFRSEAGAETYARNRKAVTELEAKEQAKCKRETKSKKPVMSTRIQTNWFCKKCGKHFNHLPNVCIRMGHNVASQRTITEKKGVDDQRLEMDRKTADDGGMTLGRGIEWRQSRW